MKTYRYILAEGVLSLVVLILLGWLCIIERRVLVIILSFLGSLYFANKIMTGIKLAIDIIEGPSETDSVFMGALSAGHLDFFFRVTVSYVYFDDTILTKDYLLFDNTYLDEIQPENCVKVVYFARSRIIAQLRKEDTSRSR